MTVKDIDRYVAAEGELSSELEDYAGRWVAVREHHVVASADTLSTLLEQIEKQAVERVFQVPQQRGLAFY